MVGSGQSCVCDPTCAGWAACLLILQWPGWSELPLGLTTRPHTHLPHFPLPSLGWRFDFVRGWPGHFAKQYIEATDPAMAFGGLLGCLLSRLPLALHLRLRPHSHQLPCCTSDRERLHPAPHHTTTWFHPACPPGEYWDCCDYTDGVLKYNQDNHRCVLRPSPMHPPCPPRNPSIPRLLVPAAACCS